MCEEQSLPKGRPLGGNDRLRRKAGKRGICLFQNWVESKRHQTGPRGFDAQAKLFGDGIAKPGRSHFRDGFTPCRHNKAITGKTPFIRFNRKQLVLPPDMANGGGHEKLGWAARRTIPHLAQEHIDDLLGASVAEQLTKGLLVEGNLVTFHQCDKILRAVGFECRSRKFRIR